MCNYDIMYYVHISFPYKLIASFKSKIKIKIRYASLSRQDQILRNCSHFKSKFKYFLLVNWLQVKSTNCNYFTYAIFKVKYSFVFYVAFSDIVKMNVWNLIRRRI